MISQKISLTPLKHLKLHLPILHHEYFSWCLQFSVFVQYPRIRSRGGSAFASRWSIYLTHQRQVRATCASPYRPRIWETLQHSDRSNEDLKWLTCLSFCSCFVIASLLLFWLLESSELFESACFELAEPKQPIADQGAHQQADDVPPSGDVSGSVVPRASPLRASIGKCSKRLSSAFSPCFSSFGMSQEKHKTLIASQMFISQLLSLL